MDLTATGLPDRMPPLPVTRQRYNPRRLPDENCENGRTFRYRAGADGASGLGAIELELRPRQQRRNRCDREYERWHERRKRGRKRGNGGEWHCRYRVEFIDDRSIECARNSRIGWIGQNGRGKRRSRRCPATSAAA